eukprot:jgi/Chlat1/5678/Chrsp37S05490
MLDGMGGIGMSGSCCSPLLDVPQPLLLRVLSFLPPIDLARFALVSRACREAAAEGALWRTHMLEKWGATVTPEQPSLCREEYVTREKVLAAIAGMNAPLQAQHIVGWSSEFEDMQRQVRVLLDLASAPAPVAEEGWKQLLRASDILGGLRMLMERVRAALPRESPDDEDSAEEDEERPLLELFAQCCRLLSILLRCMPMILNRLEQQPALIEKPQLQSRELPRDETIFSLDSSPSSFFSSYRHTFVQRPRALYWAYMLDLNRSLVPDDGNFVVGQTTLAMAAANALSSLHLWPLRCSTDPQLPAAERSPWNDLHHRPDWPVKDEETMRRWMGPVKLPEHVAALRDVVAHRLSGQWQGMYLYTAQFTRPRLDAPYRLHLTTKAIQGIDNQLLVTGNGQDSVGAFHVNGLFDVLDPEEARRTCQVLARGLLRKRYDTELEWEYKVCLDQLGLHGIWGRNLNEFWGLELGGAFQFTPVTE